MICSQMNQNACCPPLGVWSVSKWLLQREKLFPQKEGRHASFAQGNLAHNRVTAAMQRGTVTGPWTIKCYICSIWILFIKDVHRVEILSRWRVWVRWSQYQGRAAVQTPATDLMDDVSHTHLQCEHNHLHRTHVDQHNEPHSYYTVFLGHLFVPALFCVTVPHICFGYTLLSLH